MQKSGVVKFFDAKKGFGFIKQDEGGEDVFLHISALQRANIDGVREGETLIFDVEAGSRGPKAVAVKRQAAGSI